jgi:hypothetical protein
MQFKKQISLLIAFFLLVSNSGLAFNVHYCEGKIASISSVFSDEEICAMPVQPVKKTCCAKPQKAHKKCCSDKEVNLKNKAEKITVKSFSFDLNSVFYFSEFNLVAFSSFIPVFYSQDTDFYCDANAPPLYQLYCQYTFYA